MVLAEFYYWLTPLGIVLAVMMAAGTYAAIISLMGRIGVERRVQGTIADLHSFPGVKVLRTTIDMGPGWPGHKDGAAATKTIHLFHSTAEVDDAALQNLDEEARAANIQLHVLISARDGYLTGDRIRQAVPEWPEASFWFCGPAGFGAALVAQIWWWWWRRRGRHKPAVRYPHSKCRYRQRKNKCHQATARAIFIHRYY